MLNPLRGKTVTLRAYIKNDTDFPVRIQLWANIGGVYANTIPAHSEGWSVGTGKFSADWTSANVAFVQAGNGTNNGGTIQAKEAKLEIGNIPTDWSPAPEDTINQINAVSSELKQTADGMTLLATKTELNSAKNELQSGITTATNKANNAQSTANNNAQTISTHTTQISALNTGLQAKVSQTDFNTLSGRVTTAENNITAKANELSSKISSVEGKIPTTVGGRNYIRNYGLTATGWNPHNSDWKFEIISDSTAKSGQYLKATCTTASTGLSGFYKQLFDFSDGRFFGKQMTWSMDVKTSKNVKLNIGCEWGNAQSNVNVTENWQRFSKTFKVATSSNQKSWIFYSSNWNVGDIVYIRDVQLEDGTVATTPKPAVEDTQSDITKLSSEIKQTADGITLLATKTELNNAKNELQSGINTATNKANAAQNTANSAQNKADSNAQTISTHTTQISALNTGLQAKVSQTDFNTLSGRVTTAENNITAKANELSSKISSVEGKIPTTVGGRNYIRNYGLTATGWNPHNSDWKFEIISDSTAKSGQYLKATCTTASTGLSGFYKQLFDFSDGRFFGKQMTWSMDVKTSKNVKLNIGCEWGNAQSNVNVTENWQRFSKTFKVATSSNQKSWIFYSSNWNVGDIVYIRDVQLEDGSIATSPVPAIEDTKSDISNLSSQIKQTADGITLLATKTELNAAKNELQSGIKTATDKANNNAQTISTHTTQISALNTGLQAKVSQTDFNTLSGRVTTAENNITAKANELSSKITSVEGKIPTNVSTRNLILKSNDFANPHKQNGANTTVTSTDDYFVIKSTGYTANAWGGMSWNMSISEVKAGEQFSILMPVYIDSSVPLDSSLAFIIKNHTLNSSAYNYSIPTNEKDQWFNVAITFKASKDVVFDTYPFFVSLVKNGLVRIKPPMLVRGNLIPSDWQPAPEDTISQISSLSSELKQTKDGITLLATKTELNNAKNELQSGITTATNKANSNAQTISTHTTQISALNTGLSAKVSQSDFNTLSGRVTTAENNITAKANELSSKITTVESKIPTNLDSLNLMTGTRDWSTKANQWHMGPNWSTEREEYQGLKVHSTQNGYNGSHQNIFVKNGDVITFSFFAKATNTLSKIKVSSRWNGSSVYQGPSAGVKESDEQITITSEWKRYSKTIHITSDGSLQFRTEYDGATIPDGNTFYVAGLKLAKSSLDTGYSENPTDVASDISSLSSEFKQTTDSIKASVTSLDKSTVKSSSLTINSDGIVMKAGKSTTDVANAIGSYFAVNQNAIDLFADKIKVKGNMIVSGSISSDKIAASGITANVIKGGTLQSSNGSTNFELNTGKLFYNNNNTGVFRIQNGASTMGLKFSNTSVSVNGTNRILSRVILGGDRRETTLDDGKWDQGGFTGIIAETINGIGTDAHESADALRAIGDNIYFTHTYSKDVSTNVAAQGWKMETYSPMSSYPGNVVLKPYGINYRKSDIIVGDVRLDNGDGSGYWVRTIVNTLKNCFGHILNGGTSSQALNAIRSELNKISGT